MAQPDSPQSEPPPTARRRLLRKLFGRQHHHDASSAPNELPPAQPEPDAEPQPPAEIPNLNQHHNAGSGGSLKPGAMRRISRSVVPGLPRAQTFKRQLSENRTHLAPIETSSDERRAVSMDRRTHGFHVRARSHAGVDPRTSAPGILSSPYQDSHFVPPLPGNPSEEFVAADSIDHVLHGTGEVFAHHNTNKIDLHDPTLDTRSMSSEQYDALVHHELETTWILNLSMHFKDRSKREKFFVTYREDHHLWRRVTISLDYRDAPENSLEMDLLYTKYQKDKSTKIYEAIRESLPDIQFYDTVTNLKLETTDGRLHVHVVEDGNEIINYPHVSKVAHLGCRRIKEQDIAFDSHMSGFVYKVRVDDEVLIKKEIPSPDTVEEFLYEINALNSLSYSENVIDFYGVVVDEYDEHVKGLLISYADGGALIDIIFDQCKESRQGIAWYVKERWAKQIVRGLADIHESGFVQGDFTLSNVVVDERNDAKIIDINRRGCPVGWEPPEATPLMESHNHISMYIGVKSDLWQLGMVLWALAMGEDEPEGEGRPLVLGPEVSVPDWYRQITEIALDPDPRRRLQASMLLQLFPEEHLGDDRHISVDDAISVHSYPVAEFHPDGHPRIVTVNPPRGWSRFGRAYVPAGPPAYESWHYAPRGRSPPSPLPSNFDDACESPRRFHSRSAWAANRDIRPSYSDAGGDEVRLDAVAQQLTPSASAEMGPLPASRDVHAGDDELKDKEQVASAEDCGDGVEDTNKPDPTERVPAGGFPAETEEKGLVGWVKSDPKEVDADAVDGPLKEISANIMGPEHTQEMPNHDSGDVSGVQNTPGDAQGVLEEDKEHTDPVVGLNNKEGDKAEPHSTVADKTLPMDGGAVKSLGACTPTREPQNIEADKTTLTDAAIALTGATTEPQVVPADAKRSMDTESTEGQIVTESDQAKRDTQNLCPEVPPDTQTVVRADKAHTDAQSLSDNPMITKDPAGTISSMGRNGSQFTSVLPQEDRTEISAAPQGPSEMMQSKDLHEPSAEEQLPQEKNKSNESSSALEETLEGKPAAEKSLPSKGTEIVAAAVPDDTEKEQGFSGDAGAVCMAVSQTTLRENAESVSNASAITHNGPTDNPTFLIVGDQSTQPALGEAGPGQPVELIPEAAVENARPEKQASPPTLGTTEPGEQKNRDATTLPGMSNDMTSLGVEAPTNRPQPTENHVELPTPSTDYNSTPRTAPCGKQDAMKLPDSLIGVGAGHMTIDDNIMREKGIYDDDFHLIARPETLPAFMITTDAKT